jgi:hypothetical protein
LEIVVSDSVGNSTSTGIINFVIDRPLPTVTAINLEEGTAIEEGSSVALSLSLIRTKHLKTLRILCNGNASLSKSYSDDGVSTLVLETTIDSVYLPNGSNDLVVELTDYAGNVTTSDPIHFTVGGVAVPPVISGFDIEEGTVFATNEDVSLPIVATDAGGIKSIQVTLGDTVIQTYSWPKYSEVLQTRSVDTKLMIPYRRNGDYLLKVEVSDFAGNITSVSRNVTIARPVPTPTLTLSQTTDSLQASWNISNAYYLKHFQVLLDGKQLYFSMPNYSSIEASSNYGSSGLWKLKDLPSGTHDLTMVTEDQAGNTYVCDSQSITISGEPDASEYGIEKTWNLNGTLAEDWSTMYLWNFDDPVKPNWETVSDGRLGTVNQTRSGLGSTAGRIDVNTSTALEFPDSSWTLEYWGKMENNNPDSNLYVYLHELTNSYLYKRSSSTNSSWDSSYYHLSLINNEVSSNWMNTNYCSRAYRSEWHHYAIVSTGNEIKWYVDGLLLYQVADTVSKRSASGVYLYMPYSDNFVDEVRISCAARSGEELWAYVQYAQQFLPQD